MGSNHEKNRGRKSRDTLPLRRYRFVPAEATRSRAVLAGVGAKSNFPNFDFLYLLTIAAEPVLFLLRLQAYEILFDSWLKICSLSSIKSLKIGFNRYKFGKSAPALAGRLRLRHTVLDDAFFSSW